MKDTACIAIDLGATSGREGWRRKFSTDFPM